MPPRHHSFQPTPTPSEPSLPANPAPTPSAAQAHTPLPSDSTGTEEQSFVREHTPTRPDAEPPSHPAAPPPAPSPHRSRWRRRGRWVDSVLAPLAGILIFLSAWEVAVRVWKVPPYILPAPTSVLAFMSDNAAGIALNARVTAAEAIAGLIGAMILSLTLAIPMARSRFTERAMQPIAVFVQLVPVVCYTPSLVIWLGPGFAPIAVVSALFGFLPLLYNIVTGLRSADRDAVAMVASAGASTAQMVRHIAIPTAVPAVFAGLRTTIGLCLAGASLAEWFALTESGLGFAIYRGMTASDPMMIWGNAFAMALVGAIGLGLLAVAERLFGRYSTSFSSNSNSFDSRR